MSDETPDTEPTDEAVDAGLYIRAEGKVRAQEYIAAISCHGSPKMEEAAIIVSSAIWMLASVCTMHDDPKEARAIMNEFLQQVPEVMAELEASKQALMKAQAETAKNIVAAMADQKGDADGTSE